MPTVTPGSMTYHAALTERKELTLPDFQRSLVWDSHQKKDLLFSTILGFPIGSVSIGKDVHNGTPSQYLLDGQQRLDCIIEMTDPSIIVDWLDISKPNPETPYTDAELREYHETEIWAAIYEFLEVPFSTSQEKEVLDNDVSYIRVKEQIDIYNQQNQKAKSNAEKKKKFEQDMLAKTAWVNRLNDEYMFYSENVRARSMIQIFNHHQKSPDEFVLQRKKWTKFDLGGVTKNHDEEIKKLYKDLLTVKDDPEGMANVMIEHFGEGTLKTNPITPNPDPIKRKAQEDKAKTKLVKSFEEGLPVITPYLEDRSKYLKLIQEHNVGWLTFDSSGREFTEIELAKVFSLVNMAGIKLTAIELLAAKHGWREKVPLDKKVTEEFELFDAYRKISPLMGLHSKDTDELSLEQLNKWHLASGFAAVLLNTQTSKEVEWLTEIPGLPVNPSTYKNEKYKKRIDSGKKRKIAIEKISLFSFKLVSLLECNSTAQTTWKHLDGEPIKWNKLIKNINEFRNAAKLLKEDKFFERIISFSRNGTLDSILMKEMTTRCFIGIMFNRYKELLCPKTASDKNGQKFIFEMRRLFDVLLYQSVTRYWIGDADNKLPTDIRGYDSKEIESNVNSDKWEELIREMCEKGTLLGIEYHRQQSKVKNKELDLGNYHSTIYSILTYHQVLQGRSKSDVDLPPLSEIKYTFDVDHIIPKDEWKKHLTPYKEKPLQLRDMNFCHNICNLTLLGSHENRAKGKHTIDKWFDSHKSDAKYQKSIQEQIKLLADLPTDVAELKKMNEPDKYNKLEKTRSQKLIDIFNHSNRRKYLFP